MRPIRKAPRRRSSFTAGLTNTAARGQQPQVLQDMREAILSGAEPPGTLIPIDAVAEFFHVSQIPVRESLKVLLGEGLVEHVPHVGYSVAQLTFGEFQELYVIRESLERCAIPVAVDCATADDDLLVRQAHAALGETTLSEEAKGYHAASRAFHVALISPSRMLRLIHVYETVWNLTEPTQPMSRIPPDELRQFHTEHEQMVAAFIARDPLTLVAESRAHYAHLTAAVASFRDDPKCFRQADS